MAPDVELLALLAALAAGPQPVAQDRGPVGQLAAFAVERDADALERETIEDYLADLAARRKTATVSTRMMPWQIRRWLRETDPLVAVLVPVANGLLLWGTVAAGEAWLSWMA